MYSTYGFFLCVKSYSLYCSRIICIYICNLFNNNQVPRNSFIHIKVITSEKGNTRDARENLVALREQHNGVCSVSNLIASCLSLVLRRKKVKENVADTLNVNSKHGFYRQLFKIFIFTFLTQDSMLYCIAEKNIVFIWIEYSVIHL